MADKIDPKDFRARTIMMLKSAIDTYAVTVKSIRQRELKKSELCLLCGNEDVAGKCICLKKSDTTETKSVQGAKHVMDKPEDGSVMPDDKKTKDTDNDEGSGGEMAKDENLAGIKAPAKAANTVAALRARSVHPAVVASLGAVKKLAPRAMSMGKDEDMVMNEGNTQNIAAVKSIRATVSGGAVNRRLGNIRAAAKGLPKGPAVMAKVSIAEANKEMQGFKSVASNPTAMPGGKMVNPNAASPGPKAPKPIAGTMTAKNEDRLRSILGKCAMCKNDEHPSVCK